MASQRPAYDEKERERIRRALLRYKQQHRVGVPSLQLRIAEATGDPNPDRIPLKSLQRFLAATHRTDDALVHHCAGFLLKVAPPPAEEGLGRALAKFLNAPEAGVSSLAGRYRARVRPIPRESASVPFRNVVAAGAMPLLGIPLGVPQASTWKPWSVLTLEETAREGYLRATEHLAEDGEEPEPEPKDRPAWLGNTGVLVACSPSELLIMVRSFLASRLYLVRRAEAEGLMTGSVMMQESGGFSFPGDMPAGPWRPVLEIELSRLPESVPQE